MLKIKQIKWKEYVIFAFWITLTKNQINDEKTRIRIPRSLTRCLW